MTFFNSLLPSFQRQTGSRDGATATESVPTVKPHYQVSETPEAYGLTVQLPGVTKDGLELSAEADQLRITGRRAWKQPEGWATLHRETADAAYELVLSHDNALDVEKIHAELKDGVLRVSLPKAEALKPRKIAVS